MLVGESRRRRRDCSLSKSRDRDHERRDRGTALAAQRRVISRFCERERTHDKTL